MTTKFKLNQTSPTPPPENDVVDLSSTQNINGDKTFHHTIKIDADSGYNTGLALIKISKERNQRMISSYTGDMETIIGSVYWNKNFTTNNNRVGFRATRHDGSSYADLYVSINPDGTPVTYAPTPDTNDNSTKIATTAFVNNILPYTTGTWTPSLIGETTTGAMTYSIRIGNYLKLGKLVYVWGEIYGSFTTLPDGVANITGLPFSGGASTRQVGINVYGYSGGVANSVSRLCRGAVYNTKIILQINSSRETTDSGLGKTDYAKWSTESTDAYNIYITTSNSSGIRLYFSGSYQATA